MKLIQKLAENWADEDAGKEPTRGSKEWSDWNSDWTSCKQGFEAGFRKALKMAMELNGGWGLEKYESSAPGFTNPRHIQIHLALENLGEEEVE